MKFKIDENLPVSFLEELRQRGFDACSVRDQGLTGATDEVVWERVQSEERLFLTQDLDFSDIRKFRPGDHHGIILFRLKEPGRITLRQKLVALFEAEDPETWPGSFIIVTDSKIRILRPPVSG